MLATQGTKRKMDKRDACTAHPRCEACCDAQEQRRMLPEDLLIERQLVHANVLEVWRAAAVPNLYLNSRAEAVPVSGLQRQSPSPCTRTLSATAT